MTVDDGRAPRSPATPAPRHQRRRGPAEVAPACPGPGGRGGRFALPWVCALLLAGGASPLRAASTGPARDPAVLAGTTPEPSGGGPAGAAAADDSTVVRALVSAARGGGDALRGAAVFASPEAACLGCHRIGDHGGSVGPDLSRSGSERTAEELAVSLLWPQRDVAEEYRLWSVLGTDGVLRTGLVVEEDDSGLVILDPSDGSRERLALEEIDARRSSGSPMPDGVFDALGQEARADLLRLLVDLGREGGVSADAVGQVIHHASAHALAPASFELAPGPTDPSRWPRHDHPLNRPRVYDFYARQADHFRALAHAPPLLAPYPGLDGAGTGHWGAQDEGTWRDDGWKRARLGRVLAGVFRGAGVTVARAVCVRLGEEGELSACFDPHTARIAALWREGFLTISDTRHGLTDGLRLQGEALGTPADDRPEGVVDYHGYFRHGERVVFSYSIDGVAFLDAPWAEDGVFTRELAPASEHPLRAAIEGGAPRPPVAHETAVVRGSGRPYAIDTIELPERGPGAPPMSLTGLAFFPDGSALVCTFEGEVWRVDGFAGDAPGPARWRRFAEGLHPPAGLVIDADGIFVLGRDQLTRLADLDGEGEADSYECFSDAFDTSSGGHDFICGLVRDGEGRFVTSSGNQGCVRISADGSRAEVLATGFRNPDGIGLLDDGVLTVPCSEGEWTPASMICAVSPDLEGDAPPHFGYRGPRGGEVPALPLVYLPRGVDNSAGGQVAVRGGKWGPFEGLAVHLSFGTASHFLLLRDEVRGRLQGAVVPLPGEFRSGVHRGRFHPTDGQLYVAGMKGWGSYATENGCLERVRYTGGSVRQPVAFHVFANGVRVEFSAPVDASAADARRHFAQCWNYRYSGAYGSQEYSTRRPDTPGHDTLAITAAHLSDDRRALFLEVPDLQPTNQLHLRLEIAEGVRRDLFATVHALDGPFTDFPGYTPRPKTIAAHPMVADMALVTERVPNPWRHDVEGARTVVIETASNLTFRQRSFRARPGELLRLELVNPDSMPHNWVLARPGTLEAVGELTSAGVSDPRAFARHYVPKTDDVLVHTDIVPPGGRAAITFRAPDEPGTYPYLCTFPGHWRIMNGRLVVE
ncbi:MAG: plastocyanin/azurin family copper-binding protein [Planctomycetota bacterium]|nr:plastocyanin/azurin family copper-binding protein [Planctomycetota bacterium]